MKLAKSKKNEEHAPERGLWFTRSTLQEAFGLGGCAICTVVRRSERKGIHSFLYEGMMSPDVRGKFLETGGFCLRHFWMAKDIEEKTWPRGGIAVAILCEDLVRLAEQGIANVLRPKANSRDFLLRHREAPAFIAGHHCMFCKDGVEKEKFLAEALEEFIDEEQFRQLLSDYGLCVRHGELALQLWKDPGKRAHLAGQFTLQVRTLAADLHEFIRKYDYQYRGEPAGREQDSVLRAIQMFVGPNPCRPKAGKDAA